MEFYNFLWSFSYHALAKSSLYNTIQSYMVHSDGPQT